MRQVSADKGEKLPWRIRVFDRFPNRPTMVKAAEDYGLKIRASCLDSFLQNEAQSSIDYVSLQINLKFITYIILDYFEVSDFVYFLLVF